MTPGQTSPEMIEQPRRRPECPGGGLRAQRRTTQESRTPRASPRSPRENVFAAVPDCSVGYEPPPPREYEEYATSQGLDFRRHPSVGPRRLEGRDDLAED